MPIELHCEHCGKPVRAPDDAAGKRGVCPACHQSVYIPTPSDQLEPLDISPVDSEEERERARLLRESQQLASNILHDREMPADRGGGDRRAGERASAERGSSASRGAPPGAQPAAGASRPPPPPPIDVRKLLIQYVRAMVDGELAVADRLAEHIRRDMPRAEEEMQQISNDELPPTEIATIPRPVLIGFFKQLRSG